MIEHVFVGRVHLDIKVLVFLIVVRPVKLTEFGTADGHHTGPSNAIQESMDMSFALIGHQPARLSRIGCMHHVPCGRGLPLQCSDACHPSPLSQVTPSGLNEQWPVEGAWPGMADASDI